MTSAVIHKDVDGILIDNYALTRFSKMMESDKIRVERTIKHPITYGLVLPTGSPNTTTCVRRYVDNYNHELFEHIAKHLKPLKVKFVTQRIAVMGVVMGVVINQQLLQPNS